MATIREANRKKLLALAAEVSKVRINMDHDIDHKGLTGGDRTKLRDAVLHLCDVESLLDLILSS
jgi:hypothetical protein